MKFLRHLHEVGADDLDALTNAVWGTPEFPEIQKRRRGTAVRWIIKLRRMELLEADSNKPSPKGLQLVYYPTRDKPGFNQHTQRYE